MVLGLAHSFRSNISSYSRSFNSLLFFFDCSSKRGDGIFGGRGRERETKKRRRWTEVVKEYRCAKSRPRSFAVGALSFSDRAQGRVKGAPGPTRNQALSLSRPPFFAPSRISRIVSRLKPIFKRFCAPCVLLRTGNRQCRFQWSVFRHARQTKQSNGSCPFERCSRKVFLKKGLLPILRECSDKLRERVV